MFDTTFPVHYTGVRDGNRKKRSKEGKRNFSIVVFFYAVNLKTLALLGAKKSVTKNLYRKKEKWTNKEYDKHEDADSLLHDTKSRIQCLYRVSHKICYHFAGE